MSAIDGLNMLVAYSTRRALSRMYVLGPREAPLLVPLLAERLHHADARTGWS